MAIADYTPDVAELVLLISERGTTERVLNDGNPTLTDDPRVEAAIADATGLIAPQLGGDGLNTQFYAGAKLLIKLQAACLLEPSVWPEQLRPEKSAFEQWQVMLDKGLAQLIAAIIRFREEEEDGPGSSQVPIGSFPAPPSARFPLGLGWLEEWEAGNIGVPQEWG